MFQRDSNARMSGMTRPPTLSKESELAVIEEICAVLKSKGIEFTKQNLKTMNENDFYNLLSGAAFFQQLTPEVLKKNPLHVIDFFTSSNFKFKLDPKILKTITMPHNHKIRIHLIHHICKLIVATYGDSPDIRDYDMEPLVGVNETSNTDSLNIPPINIFVRAILANEDEFNKADLTDEELFENLISKDIDSSGYDFLINNCTNFIQIQIDKTNRKIHNLENLNDKLISLKKMYEQYKNQMSQYEEYEKLLSSEDINMEGNSDELSIKLENKQNQIDIASKELESLKELEVDFNEVNDLAKILSSNNENINLNNKPGTTVILTENIHNLTQMKIERMQIFNDIEKNNEKKKTENERMAEKDFDEIKQWNDKKIKLDNKIQEIIAKKENYDLFIQQSKQYSKDIVETEKFQKNKISEMKSKVQIIQQSIKEQVIELEQNFLKTIGHFNPN